MNEITYHAESGGSNIIDIYKNGAFTSALNAMPPKGKALRGIRKAQLTSTPIFIQQLMLTHKSPRVVYINLARITQRVTHNRSDGTLGMIHHR